jgi:hypothetical protein
MILQFVIIGLMNPDDLKTREELERKWEDYENRRAVFMKEMGWDERRMIKHETACSNRSLQDEPSGTLMFTCYVFTIALFIISRDLRDWAFNLLGGWVWLLGYLAPCWAAYIIHWIKTLTREDAPEFIPPRFQEEIREIHKARLEAERATGAINKAYYDLLRYVAPHWIRKAELDRRIQAASAIGRVGERPGAEAGFRSNDQAEPKCHATAA